jgi:hypothetical protein
MRRLIYTAGMIAIFAAAFLTVQRARPNPLPLPTPTPIPEPAPQATNQTITWSVPQLTPTLFPGEIITATATFTSSAALQNPVVEAVPAISGFVTLQPKSFTAVPIGQPQEVKILFSIPTSTALGSVFDGTVHLRVGGQTLPQTLKITITIAAQLLSRVDMGLAMKYPTDWIIQQEGSSSFVFTTPTLQFSTDINDATLQTIPLFQVGVLGPSPGSAETGPANPNRLNPEQWLVAYFGYGFMDAPASTTHRMIGGYPAIQITTLGLGGRQAHIYIARGADIVEVNYGLFAPVFNLVYEAMLQSITLAP